MIEDIGLLRDNTCRKIHKINKKNSQIYRSTSLHQNYKKINIKIRIMMITKLLYKFNKNNKNRYKIKE